MEYNVSDGQDEKSGCRVLFTGPGIYFVVLGMRGFMLENVGYSKQLFIS